MTFNTNMVILDTAVRPSSLQETNGPEGYDDGWYFRLQVQETKWRFELIF